MPVSQALALFAKLVRKVSTALVEIQKLAISADLPLPPSLQRIGMTNESRRQLPELDDELDEAGKEAVADIHTKQKAFIESLEVKKYV